MRHHQAQKLAMRGRIPEGRVAPEFWVRYVLEYPWLSSGHTTHQGQGTAKLEEGGEWIRQMETKLVVTGAKED